MFEAAGPRLLDPAVTDSHNEQRRAALPAWLDTHISRWCFAASLLLVTWIPHLAAA